MSRPRSFDENQVVDRAMELFWTKGYEATSVSDLTAELGVHPGSLYRTFGDKHALFLRALTRYRDSQALPLAPTLLAGGPTQAYATAKRAIRQAWTASWPEVLAAEVRDQAALGATADHRGAVDAFLAKRPPEFTGRD